MARPSPSNLFAEAWLEWMNAIPIVGVLASVQYDIYAQDDTPMPRPADTVYATALVTVTEDQARAGGCCICPPGCAGLDPWPDQRPCDPLCAWCMSGCAVMKDALCSCALLPW